MLMVDCRRWLIHVGPSARRRGRRAAGGAPVAAAPAAAAPGPAVPGLAALGPAGRAGASGHHTIK